MLADHDRFADPLGTDDHAVDAAEIAQAQAIGSPLQKGMAAGDHGVSQADVALARDRPLRELICYAKPRRIDQKLFAIDI